ncbi:MAG: hypothetical protein A3H95_18480 [Acidobacteria bacterium RIFCSPLOWO2_02_FULL_64_15]|nr:MAG: hypothetical protein A3H95_18480 [Acidobacteria bacterium RIFCSPLOWO2_02_FULL_64_15]
MRSIGLVGLIFGLAFALPHTAHAQASVHGFAQFNSAFRATGADCPPQMACDVMRGEERVQLKLELSSPDGRAGALARLDLFHDTIGDEARVDLREAYVDVGGRRISARLGRQVVTWGLGDLLFINDVFPKDWVAFLTGAPLEYLKFGSDAAKVGAYTGSIGAEVVITPVFARDRAPRPDRLFFFDPMPSLTDRVTQRPGTDFGDMQLAGRLYARVSRFEVASYVSKGFFGMPAGQPDQAVPTRLVFSYPRLNTYGGSLQGPLRAGVFSLEGGYYDSRDDESGSDPTVENSQTRWLAAYQFQPHEDLTLAFQYYGEFMRQHDAYLRTLPQGLPLRDQLRQVASLRVTQLRRHHTLRLNLFVMASPTDRDAYVNPSVRYNVTDELWLETGANVFWGQEHHTFFGQFGQNSGVFLIARYEF